LVPLIQRGRVVGAELTTIDAARAHHERCVAELPRRAHQLSNGDPAIKTEFLSP